MNIATLANSCNTSPAAIRHYERLGLFDDRHVRRLPNGYRDFTPDAVRRLELIKLGQALGFSLTYMLTELQHWDDGTMPPNEKKAVLTTQLIHVKRKVAELTAVRQRIEDEIARNC